jgi:hypothetical protein
MPVSVPHGFVLLSNTDGSGRFFDCRSVPPPRTNLVYLFRGVCNRSGYIDRRAGGEPVSRTCPIVECPYNKADDESLLAIRADYRTPPVANQRGHIVPPEPRNRIRTVRCERARLFALDDSLDVSRAHPLATCPFCGEPLTRQVLAGTPALAGPCAETHSLLWQTFDPPLTRHEAERLRARPDPNVAPSRDDDPA